MGPLRRTLREVRRQGLDDMTLSELKKLAESATGGRWYYDGYSKVFSELSDQTEELDYFVCKGPVIGGDIATKEGGMNLSFIEAFNPVTALRMIELLERAKEFAEDCRGSIHDYYAKSAEQ